MTNNSSFTLKRKRKKEEKRIAYPIIFETFTRFRTRFILLVESNYIAIGKP